MPYLNRNVASEGFDHGGSGLIVVKSIRRRVVHLLWLLPVVTILSAGAISVGFFLRSDILTFRPRLPQIKMLIKEQRSATPKLPAFLSRCLNHEAGNDIHVVRCLLFEFGLNRTSHRRWIARQTFWTVSVKWHLSIEERQFLYCRFMANITGNKGVQHAAQKLYQKPLDSLDDHQLASLVVYSRSPVTYIRNRHKLDETTKRFLAEMLGQ